MVGIMGMNSMHQSLGYVKIPLFKQFLTVPGNLLSQLEVLSTGLNLQANSLLLHIPNTTTQHSCVHMLATWIIIVRHHCLRMHPIITLKQRSPCGLVSI